LNDSLASETAPARWRWERGGWVLVNRATGKMQQIPLPEFDPYYSVAGWFRDYAAYCGISEDNKKVAAIIVQLGRRKPLLKKPAGNAAAEMPDSACPAPVWQRAPSRVTFELNGQPQVTFTVPVHGADPVLMQDHVSEQENHALPKPSGACSTARRTK